MNLDPDKALAVFRKVRQVREEMKAYCLAADRHDLSIEDFQRVVAQMYGLTIEKQQVPFEGQHVRGLVERYADRARIIIKKNQEDDWKRFVTVKELCHLMIDEKEDWSPCGVQTIKEMLAEYRDDNDDLAEKVAQSEEFAEIAATEILYPFEDRKADMETMKRDPKLTYTKIAGIYRIPEYVVGTSHTDWFHNIAVQVWSELDTLTGAAA